MIQRSKEKSDADVVNTCLSCLCRTLNVYTQCCQHIRTAALTWDRTIAMFCDGDAGARCDKRCNSRNVKRAWTITAGAAHINCFRIFDGNLDSMFAHRACKADEFIYRFAFCTQGNHQAGYLGIGCLSGHDGIQRIGRFCHRQVFARQAFFNVSFHRIL